MGTRRIAREVALQFLYQEDFTVQQGQKHGYNLDDRFPLFCTLYLVNKKARKYASELVAGVCEHLAEIDSKIEESAKNWRLPRLAAIDRNVMRIAVYEMCYSGEVPGQVAMNEALEITKKYSSEDSPKFVNGILDAIFTASQSERLNTGK